VPLVLGGLTRCTRARWQVQSAPKRWPLVSCVPLSCGRCEQGSGVRRPARRQSHLPAIIAAGLKSPDGHAEAADPRTSWAKAHHLRFKVHRRRSRRRLRWPTVRCLHTVTGETRRHAALSLLSPHARPASRTRCCGGWRHLKACRSTRSSSDDRASSTGPPSLLREAAAARPGRCEQRQGAIEPLPVAQPTGARRRLCEHGPRCRQRHPATGFARGRFAPRQPWLKRFVDAPLRYPAGLVPVERNTWACHGATQDGRVDNGHQAHGSAKIMHPRHRGPR